MSARSRTSRLPRLAVVAWSVALVALALLAVAVWHYLSGSGGGGMGGMDMGGAHEHPSVVDALSRAGAEPFGPLLGTKLFTAWHLDALALALLVLFTAWYLTCVALVSVRRPGSRWPPARTFCFLGGIAVCAFATNGSIAVYDQVLFSAHMVGHLALVMVGPALLVAGQPLRLAIESSPADRAERITRIVTGRVMSLLTAPPVALATYTVVIVGSHLTGVMDDIMRNSWAGQVEHLVYVVAGYQFFVLVVGNEPIRWRMAAPARWLLLAVAMAVDTFTGIVLMQGTSPIELLSTPGVHVDALSDTRTGGAIMWFGGDAIMAVVMVVLVIGWLRRVDTHEADEKGWLEQARRATFAEHTGTEADDPETFDDDDVARTSYNEWLTKLEQQG
ncbi:MAG: cytochrome c oxidase assembly protein [Jatrophihabitantaceae bacterium]